MIPARLKFEHVACLRGERLLFEDMNFALGKGEAALLTGPNGAGKSSLMRIACGLLAASAGKIERDGGVAFAGEAAALDARLPLAGALLFWAKLDGVGRSEVVGALDAMGIANLAEVPVRMLSTGQRKRVALIGALQQQRPILVLDEWAADQDPPMRQRFYREILPSLRAQGIAVIAVTHDDRYFDAADQVLRMEYGQLMS